MPSSSTQQEPFLVSVNTSPGPDLVDVRGPRFVAWVTTAVLVVTLAVAAYSVPAAATLLALQALVFAVGAWRGPKQHPYGRIFAAVQKVAAVRKVAPRPATEREPVPPLKFAQLVGFVFAAAGTAGFVLNNPLIGIIATAFALFAAFLNAAFGICLGCQIYPLLGRLRSTRPLTPTATSIPTT
jgi:MFS family permease